jgi:hypothetical protein
MNRQNEFKRKVHTREPYVSFLIICEGEKTEPNYFRKFRLLAESIGFGQDPLNVVKEAIKRKERAKQTKNPYDQVWAVFDKDDFPKERFNEAIQLARRGKIGVAYSIEAFELWYLLHFNYYDTAISRKDYCKKLSGMLGHKYKKNSKDMYNELAGRQQEAIKNAKRLFQEQEKRCKGRSDCYKNPSTTVFRLLEELNKHNKRW